MSVDIGWLPLGAIVLFAIGLVIRARIQINRPIGESAPTHLSQILCSIKRRLPSLRTIGLLLLGFILGSWVTLVIMQLGTLPINPSLFYRG